MNESWRQVTILLQGDIGISTQISVLRQWQTCCETSEINLCILFVFN